MRFSERMGIVPTKRIQLDTIDMALRNRLINIFKSECENDLAVYVLDRFGKQIHASVLSTSTRNINLLITFLENCHWYELYDAIECVAQYYMKDCNSCGADCSIHVSSFADCNCSEQELLLQFKLEVNAVLEQEKSGYRLINGEIAKITDENEIDAITTAMASEFETVNMHLGKALALYSDRSNPDYNNSVKESISAVEAMCCVITGESGKTATLGNTLKKLEENGVHIHPSLKIAFDKMYGYTSDEAGIRHGSIEFVNVPAEDAKFMLVACSAFINYLKEKME